MARFAQPGRVRGLGCGRAACWDGCVERVAISERGGCEQRIMGVRKRRDAGCRGAFDGDWIDFGGRGPAAAEVLRRNLWMAGLNLSP